MTTGSTQSPFAALVLDADRPDAGKPADVTGCR